MNEKLRQAEDERKKALEWVVLGRADAFNEAAKLAESYGRTWGEASATQINPNSSTLPGLEIAKAIRARIPAGVTFRECRAEDIGPTPPREEK